MSRWETNTLAWAVVFFSVGISEAGTILYVDDSATGANNGSSWFNAYPNLQEAISAAEISGGTVTEIHVAQGIYKPSSTGDRTATFRMLSNVSMLGGYAGYGATDPNARDIENFSSIFSGDLAGNDGTNFQFNEDNSFHVVTYNDPDAINSILDGFIVTAGNADGTGPAEIVTNQGGGIHIRNGSAKCLTGGPIIRNCIVEWNTGAHHGAINDHALTTVIENCVIRYNHAGTQGGGLQIHSGATAVNGCSFINNSSSGEGAGIWTGHDNDATCIGPSHPTITDCVFEGNTAIKGGGMFINGSTPVVERSIFESNRALTDNGGAIYNNALREGGLTVKDSTFTANTCWNHGGAIYNLSSSGEFRDTLFDRNEAVGTAGGINGGGGAIYCQGTDLIIERCEFRDSIAMRYGGAINIANGIRDVTVKDSLFTGNVGYAQGGAINIASGRNLSIVGITFVKNRAGYDGGAIHASHTYTFQLANCGFYSNRASVNGGALSLNNIQGVLVNVVASGNWSASNGNLLNFITGGDQTEPNHIELHNFTTYVNDNPSGADIAEIFLKSFSDTITSELIIRNSILWEADTIFGFEGFPTQLDISFSNMSEDWSGEGMINLDPQFINAAGPDGIVGTIDDDFRLYGYSPSRDTGNANTLPTDTNDLDHDGNFAEPIPIDLLGQLRQQGNEVDMGAYEVFVETDCLPGTYSATGQTPCTDCPDGTYQPDAAQLSCLPCEGCAACITDICDSISGVCGTGCSVPAVSTWGLITLALSVLIAGSILMKKNLYRTP